MSIRTTYSAENWERIYTAFSDISFTSYDFDTIKQSLVDYTKTYYAESFNDYMASSEFMMLISSFAYVAEQLAYRVDMVSHENFITTAQRKQSILRLAKLISYKATRNIPVRGLVKINTITVSERLIDSRGVDLSGQTITWNDPNNANWKEQFLLAMNGILTNRFGLPSKTFQIGDVVMDLYTIRNDPNSLRNGVYPFTAQSGQDSHPMEVVPADLDGNGPFEREPDLTSPMSIIYANDGIGDGSDYTGFLMYVKQGTLTRIDYTIDLRQPDRRIEFNPTDVNNTDVWVQRVENGQIIERWKQVDTVSEQNLVFNNDRTTRRKYEVDTRENDQITVIFGDGDFSDIPVGSFQFWMRQSANQSLVIQKNKVVGEVMGFAYNSSNTTNETCGLTFSLTTTLQNGSASETIEHIRRSAPSTYYSQNRMVNGQDYNTYLLKDPTIIREKAINRTFAGQPKYIDWNDASGMYENIKLFGDDLTMQYSLGLETQTTSVSGQSLIDSVIEPLLSSPGIINMMLHISATDPLMAGVVAAPRRRFIEDNRGGLYFTPDGSPVPTIWGAAGAANGSLKEKTTIQGLIDRHYYGEPLEYIQGANGQVMAKIPDPDLFPRDDSKIYAANVPRTIDGVNKYPPGDIGSGLQPIAEQDDFALRYHRYMMMIGNAEIELSPTFEMPWGEVFTVEVAADGVSFYVRSNLRGTMNSGTIGKDQFASDWYEVLVSGAESQPAFRIWGTTMEAGDTFILDRTQQQPMRMSEEFTEDYVWPVDGAIQLRAKVNLDGWWEVMGSAALPYYAGGQINDGAELLFTTDENSANLAQHGWLIFIHKVRQAPGNTIIGYEVHHRTLTLSVTSENTNFWYNESGQLIDSETKNRVMDNIKVLGSNLNSEGEVLKKSQVYDVVGPVKNQDGIVDRHSLSVVPTDLLNENDSGDLIADRILQFEMFSLGSYSFFRLDTGTHIVGMDQYSDAEGDHVTLNGEVVVFAYGGFIDNTVTYGRRQVMPGVNNNESGNAGLDFMWQHFAPYTNIIDPSVTNIHDVYVMPRGYYDNVINFVRGTSPYPPTPPTPLELRNSYGYLLENKMLSDTVVLHPGKIRLLFGSLAEPQLRAKFKVVRSQTATLTDERIKEEILSVINTFFEIDGWDFGTPFYATKLITLIHQRLPADIASVVLVPLYSMNSFGSLFTVDSGFDEILQSAAAITDIEIVDALTSTVIRQGR